MSSSVQIYSDHDKVTWTRPDGEEITMSVDEFHFMYRVSKTTLFRLRYPVLVERLTTTDMDTGAEILMEVFRMSKNDADEIVIELAELHDR